MFCAKFGWNWPSGSGEKDFKICQCIFCYFVIISPWKRTWSFLWTNSNPLPPGMFYANLVGKERLKFAQSFWRRRFTSALLECLPLEKRWPFIKTKNSVHLRMLCVRFSWNWPGGYGEKDFNKFCQCIFGIISSWKKVWSFIWKTWVPFIQRSLSQVWLKLAQWFWRRRWKCEKLTDGRLSTCY